MPHVLTHKRGLESSGKTISIHNSGNMWVTLFDMAAYAEQTERDEKVLLLMEIMGNNYSLPTAWQTQVKNMKILEEHTDQHHTGRMQGQPGTRTLASQP